MVNEKLVDTTLVFSSAILLFRLSVLNNSRSWSRQLILRAFGRRSSISSPPKGAVRCLLHRHGTAVAAVHQPQVQIDL